MQARVKSINISSIIHIEIRLIFLLGKNMKNSKFPIENESKLHHLYQKLCSSIAGTFHAFTSCEVYGQNITHMISNNVELLFK